MLAGMSRRSEAVARWQEIFRRQSESGLSVAAFCRRSRISQPSFYIWRRRLRESGTFAEVCLPSESPRSEGIGQSRLPHQDGALEVVLSHGLRIVVHSGFDRVTRLARWQCALQWGLQNPTGR